MGRAVNAESMVVMRQQACRIKESLGPQIFKLHYIKSITSVQMSSCYSI